MKILSYLFLLMGLIAFTVSLCARFGLVEIRSYPVTFIHISELGVLISIAFAILSLDRK